MSSIAVPTSAVGKRRLPWVIAVLVSLAAVGVFALASAMFTQRSKGLAPGDFHVVGPMDMDVTINKDGDLQAVNNVDIVSPVEGHNVILDIVREGSFVRKGDIVVRIDSSDIERKIENAMLDLQKAQADLTNSREQKEIQESKNAADLEAAQVELTLARLDLLQYTEGEWPAQLQKARTAVEMARINVKNKEDDLAQTRALFNKGFVTAADVKKSELDLLQATNELEQKTSDLNVLEKYTHEKNLTEKKNKVAQADRKLIRVQRENASSLAQRMADLRAKEQTLALREQQYEHLQEQLAACTIRAPSDGMVVYGSSGPSSTRRDSPIQPGAQVRQQELLIRLPDTTSMKAICKIPETQVTRLHVDPNSPIRATVSIPGHQQTFSAWISNISVLADSSNRWWNPDSKEYPVEVTLVNTPAGLKPGMSVEVRMFIDRLRNVLAVPLASIYASGRDSYVFVREAQNVRPQLVALGAINDTHAQILDGVSAGHQVLILQAGQGRELLERAGIRPTPTQPSEEDVELTIDPALLEQNQNGGSRRVGAPGENRRSRQRSTEDGGTSTLETTTNTRAKQ